MNLQGLMDFLKSDEGTRSLMGFGQAMTAAGQPSRIPISTATGISQGLAGGMGGYDEAMKLKQQKLLQARQQLMDESAIRLQAAQAQNYETEAAGRTQEQNLLGQLTGGAGATQPTGLMGAVNAGMTGPDMSAPPAQMPAMSPADALLMVKSPTAYAARADKRKADADEQAKIEQFIKTIPENAKNRDRIIALVNNKQFEQANKLLSGGGVDDTAIDNERESRGQVYGQEAGLRKDYTQELGDFTKLAGGYRKIQESYSTNANKPEGETSGPADMSLIFGYMKILDPGSTVREGEYATAANAGGVPASVFNLYNNIVGGGKLSGTVRKQFYTEASKLYKRELKGANAIRDRYRKIAAGYPGVKPERAIYDLDAIEDMDLGVPDPTNSGGKPVGRY